MIINGGNLADLRVCLFVGVGVRAWVSACVRASKRAGEYFVEALLP